MPWNFNSFEHLLDQLVDVNRLGWTLFLALAVYVFCQRHAFRRTGRKLLRRFPPEDVHTLGENICKQKRSASWPVVRSLSTVVLEKSHLQSRSRVDIDGMIPVMKKRRQGRNSGRFPSHDSIREASGREELCRPEFSADDEVDERDEKVEEHLSTITIQHVSGSGGLSGSPTVCHRLSAAGRGRVHTGNMAVSESASTDMAASNSLQKTPDAQEVPLRRRGSILYRSEPSESDDLASLAAKYASLERRQSEGQEGATNVADDEHMVTPFARILSRLGQVKVNLEELLGHYLKADAEIGCGGGGGGSGLHNKDNWQRRKSAMTAAEMKSFSSVSSTSEPRIRRQSAPSSINQSLAKQTFLELSWCLTQLEHVHLQTTLGGMATDKIRRIMNKELSHFSGSSGAGNQVVEWVSKTYRLNDPEPVEHLKEEVSCKPRSLSLFKHLVRPRGSIDEGEAIPRFGVRVDDEDSLEMLLNDMNEWNFNTFKLTELTEGNPLVCICWVVFKSRDLFRLCKIPERTAVNFFTAIEANYRDNPYHSRTHAADVVQAANYLLQASRFEGLFSALETFTVLFAAAIHDVGHLGLNNQFLVQTKHDLAVLYHDESVMENHHLAVAFRLLLGEDCNMLSNLAEDEQRQVKRNAVRLVLATDITREVNNLAALRTLVETSKVSKDGVLLLNNYADRIQVLECLLHCADVSNPARPSALSIQWTDCIVEEFYCQGDEERRLGLPVSPMMDRHNPSVEKSQVAFIEVICYPLWESWAELVHPCGQVMLDNLLANKAHWQDRLSPPPGLSFGSYSDSSVCILGEAVKVIIGEESLVKEGEAPSETSEVHDDDRQQELDTKSIDDY